MCGEAKCACVPVPRFVVVHNGSMCQMEGELYTWHEQEITSAVPLALSIPHTST